VCSSKDSSAFISVGTFNRLPDTRAYLSSRKVHQLSKFSKPFQYSNVSEKIKAAGHSRVSVRVLSNSVSTGHTAESVVTIVQEKHGWNSDRGTFTFPSACSK
jgi:hypothetical protein